LNYAYRHPSSSAKFYPYAPHVNLINHNRTNPNVAIQWSSNEYFEDCIYHLCQRNDAHFSWDYVALRDISIGEEIFLDYGKEWDEAWQKHLNNFQPEEKPYEPAYLWNNLTVLETIQLPSNIYAECNVRYNESNEHFEENNSTWKRCIIHHQKVIDNNSNNHAKTFYNAGVFFTKKKRNCHQEYTKKSYSVQGCTLYNRYVFETSVSTRNWHS